MNTDTVKVRITQACMVAPLGQTARPAAVGEEIEMPTEDAFNVIGSGRGFLIGGNLPNNLTQKNAPQQATKLR